MALAAFGAFMLISAVIGARDLPRNLAFNTTVLLPSALLGFAALAVVAPLVAGGGYELYPDDQLTPYPVRPATTFIASVIQAPLNLAWMAQVMVLAAATSFATTETGSLPVALVLLALYVAMTTILGQAIAWLVVVARQSRPGRATVWSVAMVLAGACAAAAWTHHVTVLLDRSPTVAVVTAMVARHASRSIGVAGVLVVTGIAAAWAGVRFVSWAHRRPTLDQAVRRQSTPVRRRGPRRSAYDQLLATDRASVWRSTALRRGTLVTAVLPGVLAAFVGVDWFTITAIPGLVAAGAGLLYGVNAFSLDAQGAVWLASQPLDPCLQMRAKLRVVTETCLVAGASSLVLATLHAHRTPTVSELAAAVASLIGCSATVVAICSDLSVTRPHRADLRGVRDTPAPPGAMVVYSVRLATVATLLGMTFGAIGRAGAWAVAVLLAGAITALALVSVHRDLRRYADPGQRALVASTVANG
jgi:hypothetical protein